MTSVPFASHPGKVSAVAVTPDGDQIVTSGSDGTARLWDRRSGEEQRVLRGHSDWVRAVAVTPGGHEIVSGGSEGSIRVWDRQKAAKFEEPTLAARRPPGCLPGSSAWSLQMADGDTGHPAGGWLTPDLRRPHREVRGTHTRVLLDAVRLGKPLQPRRATHPIGS